MNELRAQLRQALSDVFGLYIQAHIFHWNVEGADFFTYHKMFEDIYQDVYDSIDPLAEHLRAVGGYTHPTPSAIFTDSTESTGMITSSSEMVKVLINMNAAVVVSLTNAEREATEAKQIGVANFLADRIDAHMKWNWFLRASRGN